MEKELYKALALVLLESRRDQWGNEIQSPLAQAIEKWARENREEIAEVIIKKLGVKELAEQLSKNIAEKLLSSSAYTTNYDGDSLKKLTLDKVAQALAYEQLKKLQAND